MTERKKKKNKLSLIATRRRHPLGQKKVLGKVLNYNVCLIINFWKFWVRVQRKLFFCTEQNILQLCI